MQKEGKGGGGGEEEEEEVVEGEVIGDKLLWCGEWLIWEKFIEFAENIIGLERGVIGTGLNSPFYIKFIMSINTTNFS